jgi:adenylosuccinate synthase
MTKSVIVLSGPMASGKTTLAERLQLLAGFAHAKTSAFLRSGAAGEMGRGVTFASGQLLDAETGGAWIAPWVRGLCDGLRVRVAVDAVRTVDQLEHLRRSFGDGLYHVHLTADESILRARFAQRGEGLSWADAQAFEFQQNQLAAKSDQQIQTDRITPDEIALRVCARLGAYLSRSARNVDVLIGGQYGSEGKGHIAAFMAHEYDVLVRGGGPNAGHQVWEDGGSYCFHHLPSGSRRNKSAQIVLAPGATVYVPKLLSEIDECNVGPARLAIDPNVMIVEESDREFESKGLVGAIGSTGQGVGSATSRRALRGAGGAVRLAKDHPDLAPFVRETQAVLENAYRQGFQVLVEGTQGTGLSLYHGPYPHVTSRDTCASGALSEAGIPPTRVRRVVMVCRTFPIRVQSPAAGTSGPMAHETDWDKVAQTAGVDAAILREKEKTSTTKRQRRVSEFDWSLLRKAAQLNGPTDIALTFADYLSPDNKNAKRYDQLTAETQEFIRDVEAVAVAPVSFVATGFGFQTIIDRRCWRE